MNWLIGYLLTVLPPVAAALGLGYIIGVGRGEQAGYKLGYHEGQFDET